MRRSISRRTVIETLARLAGGLAVAGPAGLCRPPRSGPAVDFPDGLFLDGLFLDGDALYAVGRHYLRRHRDEADRARLRALLATETALPDGAGWRRHLARLTAADFAAGDVTIIGGWVLARSEARFMALASLAARP